LSEPIAAELAVFAGKVETDGDCNPKEIGLPGDAGAQIAASLDLRLAYCRAMI
jgi:hypothetical protein